MTDNSCANCAYYERWVAIKGHCCNPRNAKVEYVGGGGEYSSSRQCAVPMAITENMVCDHHEVATPPNFRQAYEMVELPRSPDLQPWQPTPWARV